ncbi:MAG: hypothetical protein HKO58_09900 [Gammaproteobacteria bacterium]|nr:hypothetical protein [Gammaproteobacteria bacterium]
MALKESNFLQKFLCLGGAIALLLFGALTIFGPISQIIGIPLLLIFGIAYGFKFEKAFWFTLIIAIALMFLWLGFDLYQDINPTPTTIALYLAVLAGVIALFVKILFSNIQRIDAEAAERKQRLLDQREADARKEAARQLVAEKNIQPREGEPLPPWLKFPGHDFFSALERFGFYGSEEEYRDKEWFSYFNDLTINQRHAYFNYYDLGDQWLQRSDWEYSWLTWERNENYSDYLEKLVKEATPEVHPNEPLAPWFKYPELADSTVEWREGKGKDYLDQTYFPFFKALTKPQQQDYLSRYDLGLGWDDRDEWMWLIGWDNDTEL